MKKNKNKQFIKDKLWLILAVLFVTALIGSAVSTVAQKNKSQSSLITNDQFATIVLHFGVLSEGYSGDLKSEIQKIETTKTTQKISAFNEKNFKLARNDKLKTKDISVGFSNYALSDMSDGWATISENLIVDKKVESMSPKNKIKCGIENFEKGLVNTRYHLDSDGTVNYLKSYECLISFIKEDISDKDYAISLLLLGEVSSRLAMIDYHQASSVFFLEAIREFPASHAAQTAWKKLKRNIEFGYSGSGNVEIPKSWKDVIVDFREMAYFDRPKVIGNIEKTQADDEGAKYAGL